MSEVLVPPTGSLAVDVDAINAASTGTSLAPYISQTYQEFQFKTKPAPQMTGIGGAHWEHIPIASMPPQLDISIPNSFGNAVSAALSNLTGTVAAAGNTLKTITQDLQNAVCSFNSLVDSLLLAQTYAEDFAKSNNQTKIYVRPIGLQPPGTVTSLNSFNLAVQAALHETGDTTTVPGKVPKILPAEIPLDPIAIADALGSGGGAIEEFLEGKSFDVGPFTASTGAGLGKLSNDNNFQSPSSGGGFSASSLSYPIFSLTRLDSDGTGMEAVISTSATNLGDIATKITISNSSLVNNGTFIVTKVVNQSFSGTVKIRYDNPLGTTELVPGPTELLTILGVSSISAADKIREVLNAQGLLAKNAPRTISVSNLVDILVKAKVVGSDPDLIQQDRSIATERLARLNGATNFRVGGIVLVGQAPDLAHLAAKIGVLANMIEFLKPLADELAMAAAALLLTQSTTTKKTATGIEFDPTKVNLSKLDSSQNVGVKDVISVKEKTKKSGALDFKLSPLVSYAKTLPQPAPTNFHAWRSFTPVDFIPGLNALNDITSGTSSNIANAIGGAFGDMASLISDGQDQANNFLSQLESKALSAINITDDINKLNQKIQDGLNFVKDLIGAGPIKMDGHLIGAQLDLLSNDDFIKQVIGAVRDVTDPNRPTFGPPPSQSVLDSQQALQASVTGQSATVPSTKIWFGILIFIVGNGRTDLGSQMRTLAGLLSMDSTPVALPPKKKISGPF